MIRSTLYADLLRSAGCEPEVSGDATRITVKATCGDRYLELYEGLKPGSSVWTLEAKIDRKPILLNAREFNFGGSGGGAANMERGTRWPTDHVLKVLGLLIRKLTGKSSFGPRRNQHVNHRRTTPRLAYHGSDTSGIVLRTSSGLYVTGEDELSHNSERAKVFSSLKEAGDFAETTWGSIRGLRAYRISHRQLHPEML